MTHPLLVVGFGNSLRGDDGAGPRLALAIEAQSLPGVRAMTVHQLTPELVDPIQCSQAVLFLDAALVPAVRLHRVRRTPAITGGGVGPHRFGPEVLLGLTHELYGSAPPSWLMLLPAAQFDFKDGLSECAKAGVSEGLRLFSRFACRLLPASRERVSACQ